MHDTIVVGGGPIGSYVAYRLADSSHSVSVLEMKSAAGEPVCCTGIVGQECADTFDIDDRVILRRVNSASLYSPSGKRLYLRREEPQACILDRAAFDKAMADKAEGAGAEYHFNSRVRDIAIESDRATVTALRQGKEYKIQAKCVVIACGFSPGLLQRLGLGGFGDFAAGAQAEVTTPGNEEVEAYFGDMAPGFFAWLVPTGPTTARAGLLSRENPGRYLKMWLKELAAKGKITSAEAPLKYGGIPLKPLRRTYGERLIVAGDAAGQVKPTSGGGIYYGLIGADIAAGTLHQALADGDLSAKRLARYERGWRKRLGRELRTGYWARKLYERLSNEQIDRIFEIVKASGIDEALLKAEDLSFDWHGKTIMRLLKYQMVAKTIGAVKIPVRARLTDSSDID